MLKVIRYRVDMRFPATVLAVIFVLRDVYSAPAAKGEQKLIKQLSNKVDLDQNDEKTVKQLIDDEKGLADNEAEDIPFRMKVDQVVEKLKVLDDDELNQVKKLFKKKLGQAATDKIFLEAHRIYNEEQEEIRELELELWFDKEQEDAFSKLVEDIKHGKDPKEEQDKKILYGIEEVASDIDALPEDLKMRMHGLIVNRYGEDTATQVFDKLEEMKNYVDDLLENEWQNITFDELDSEEEDVEEGKRFWENLGLEVPDTLLAEDPWATDTPESTEEEEKEAEEAEKTRLFWKKLGIASEDDFGYQEWREE